MSHFPYRLTSLSYIAIATLSFSSSDAFSLETATDNIKQNSRHLAKRQMTWFRTQMDTHFYEVNLDNINETIDTIYKDLKEFLS